MNLKRAPSVLGSVVGVSFLAALAWGIFGPELLPARSSGADALSRSALGHKAFVDLLREIGIPVVVSRFNSGEKARRSALLIVAEPSAEAVDRARMLRGMIGQAHRTLLVLPKWEGVESKENPAWIESAEMIPQREVDNVLRAVGADAEVVRVPGDGVSWQSGEIGAVPRIAAPQLLRGPTVVPVVRCADGALVAWVRTQRGSVLVLSDPDLLSNHGLARPGNARAMLGILALARGEKDAVVIDETLHGFGKEPSVFRSLFEFPLALATIQALLAVAVLLWAAMGRFGAPLPEKPPLEAGKKALIGNIAALLAFGGHNAQALRRYFERAVGEVRAALHMPATLTGADADAWLDRASATLRLSELRRLVEKGKRPDPRRTLAIALRIHRWREELIRGRVGHP